MQTRISSKIVKNVSILMLVEIVFIKNILVFKFLLIKLIKNNLTKPDFLNKLFI